MQNTCLRVIPCERWRSGGIYTQTPTSHYLRVVECDGKWISTALENTLRQKDTDTGSWKPHKQAEGSGDVSRKLTASSAVLFIAVGSTWQIVSTQISALKWMNKCESMNGNEVLTSRFHTGNEVSGEHIWGRISHGFIARNSNYLHPSLACSYRKIV